MASRAATVSSPVESVLAEAIKVRMGSDEDASSLLKWIENTELRIVVAGKTGAGKSTLLNTFLGVDVFETGDSFDRVTDKVTETRTSINGINVIVWDCPGLQDGSGKEDEYLQELKRNTNNDIHLVLYCIDMMEVRSDLHWGSAITKITEAFGSNIWNHTALVLTFANMFERELVTMEEPEDRKKVLFTARVNEWQEKFCQRLACIHDIEQSTIDGIKVLPAGKNGRVPLCGQKDWLSDLWADILNKVRSDAKQAVIKLNEDRFIEVDEDDEELEVDQHRQLIMLTENVKRALQTAADDHAIEKLSAKSKSSLGSAIRTRISKAMSMIADALISMYKNRKNKNDYKVPDQKGT